MILAYIVTFVNKNHYIVLHLFEKMKGTPPNSLPLCK